MLVVRMLEDKNVIRGLMFCLTYQIDLPRTLISICTSSCIKYTDCAAETEKLIKPIESKIRCELNHQMRLCLCHKLTYFFRHGVIYTGFSLLLLFQ